MRIKVSVSGTTKANEFEVDANAGTKFVVKHTLGEIKFKVADIKGNYAIIQTNEPMCKSDGLHVRLSDRFKRFDWDMNLPLYVATPTMDYGVIVGIELISEA